MEAGAAVEVEVGVEAVAERGLSTLRVWEPARVKLQGLNSVYFFAPSE